MLGRRRRQIPNSPACCTRTSVGPATTIEGETMLIHPLAERLRALGMTAMADTFLQMQLDPAAADLPREDWLGLLLDREVTARDNKRLGRRLSQARLRQNAVVEDTDFRAPRGLDRALFHTLAGCDWIRHSPEDSPHSQTVPKVSAK